MAAVSRGRSGRGGRCVHGANGRTNGRALTRRLIGRADGAERARTVGQTGAERVRTVKRTGGLGSWGLHCTDDESGKRADGRTGRSGAEEQWSGGLGGWANGEFGGQANGRTGADGQTSGWAWV